MKISWAKPGRQSDWIISTIRPVIPHLRWDFKWLRSLVGVIERNCRKGAVFSFLSWHMLHFSTREQFTIADMWKQSVTKWWDSRVGVASHQDIIWQKPGWDIQAQTPLWSRLNYLIDCSEISCGHSRSPEHVSVWWVYMVSNRCNVSTVSLCYHANI